MFSKKLNKQWQANGDATTPLGLYLDVDFELVETLYLPSELWYEREHDRSDDIDYLLQQSALYNHLITEVDMTLVVVK